MQQGWTALKKQANKTSQTSNHALNPDSINQPPLGNATERGQLCLARRLPSGAAEIGGAGKLRNACSAQRCSEQLASRTRLRWQEGPRLDHHMSLHNNRGGFDHAHEVSTALQEQGERIQAAQPGHAEH
eukprot:15450226-Alexandrium_andersonii.AAC.1